MYVCGQCYRKVGHRQALCAEHAASAPEGSQRAVARFVGDSHLPDDLANMVMDYLYASSAEEDSSLLRPGGALDPKYRDVCLRAEEAKKLPLGVLLDLVSVCRFSQSLRRTLLSALEHADSSQQEIDYPSMLRMASSVMEVDRARLVHWVSSRRARLEKSYGKQQYVVLLANCYYDGKGRPACGCVMCRNALRVLSGSVSPRRRRSGD